MSTGINLGNRVKRLREASGVSQIQLAQFLNVDQSYISKCENDERQFNVNSLEKLCNLFGCEMNDLFDLHSKVETLNFAFRAKTIDNDDFAAISDINRIALNIREMNNLLEV
jgi:transcriptional regulator with XRE-family HTH domain